MPTTNTEAIIHTPPPPPDRQERVKSYLTIEPPTHQLASMYTYSIVGGGGGALPTSPHPLNTCSHNTATRRPPHPSNTQQCTTTHNNRQQHTTTVHNSTLVHKNTNVPLFKKLFDIIFFWWENHFMSHFEGHFEGVKRGVKGSKGVCAVNFLALLILLKGKV